MKNSKISAFLKKYIVLFILLCAVFTFLKTIIYILPNEPIQKNIRNSMEQINEEGVYPRMFYSGKDSAAQRLDNYSEAIYLNVAYASNQKNVLNLAMGDYRASFKGMNPLEALNQLILSDGNEKVSYRDYARHWMGSEVFIRPLLMFFTLPQIRLIYQAVFIILIFCTCRISEKTFGKKIGFSLLMALLSVNMIVLCSSSNFLGSFFVALIGIIVVCKKDYDESATMFVVGGVTSFLDLLVTPMASYTFVRGSINRLFKTDIRDIMTGYRAFSYLFVKSFPVLSKGFEIETEMTIHAVDKNMRIENVIIEYRDRPEGSESKLNTYSDGFKVLKTIGKLYKNYHPLGFFGRISTILILASALLFLPIAIKFLQTGFVPNFPTLIVSGFIAVTAIISYFAGLILETLTEKERQEFEFRLQVIENLEKSIKNIDFK